MYYPDMNDYITFLSFLLDEFEKNKKPLFVEADPKRIQELLYSSSGFVPTFSGGLLFEIIG